MQIKKLHQKNVDTGSKKSYKIYGVLKIQFINFAYFSDNQKPVIVFLPLQILPRFLY